MSRLNIFVAALAVALSFTDAARAADSCEQAPYRITLPGAWTSSVDEDIASYRNRSATEGVTAAVYLLTVPGAAARNRALHKAVELHRALEHRAGAGVELSAVTRTRSGRFLQMRFSGYDRVTQRRFESLTVASHCYVQHFYYEAIDLTEVVFARRAQTILGGLKLEYAAPPAAALPATMVLPELVRDVQAILPRIALRR